MCRARTGHNRLWPIVKTRDFFSSLLDSTSVIYRLLCALADHPEQVLSAQELAERVWGSHDAGIHDTLGVHLRRLRAKLKADPGNAPAIVAVRGFGYRLTCDAHHSIADRA